MKRMISLVWLSFFKPEKKFNSPPCCAQCSPRHACPLKRSLLMQVHEPAQAAPVLAWWGK
ncbi:hypothetical protein FDX08_21125 [Citrobacter sp. wls712]|nr:hypothetical protein FDX08_21125 [Citrobacter sp. wls712]